MKTKFKVGDLVKLSAAGRKADQNSCAVGGWGIIIKINPDKFGRYTTPNHFPIKCQWYGGNGYGDDPRSIRYKPYELKFYKKNT